MVGDVAQGLAAVFVSNDPNTQALLGTMAEGLMQALMTDYLISGAALL